MKKLLFWTLLLLCCVSMNAQDFQDNFDDLSFPTDPDWFGETGIYEVNGLGELQLMDTAAGESSVYVLAPTADSTTWEFYFRLEFDPSTSNFLKVYLQSDAADLDSDLNGYFLQIGLAGTQDSIVLRRQDGNSVESLIAGVAGGVANDPSARIRVVRTANAEWQLFVDYTGGNNLELEGTAIDATYPGGDYFGFKCKYGVTRRDLFYFDDVKIGPLVQDETPPTLLSAMAVDGNNVVLQFDEPLDQVSAETSSNYTLDNGVSVIGADLLTDPSLVNIEVTSLVSGLDYTVSVNNVSDLNNNPISSGQANFTYFLIEDVEPFDILINEVFPNPEPTVTALPDAEFIELFNRSDKAINLEGFEIFDANNSKTLSTYIFPPQSYLIVCDINNVNDYTPFGNVLGVSGLFALNDSGDDAGLKDIDGIEIHRVTYNTESYQDEDKAGGGWSLELVNPNLYCQGISNWQASIASDGGTPGQENSLFNNTPDNIPPLVLDAIAISASQVRVFFNETMGASVENISAYTLDGAGDILTADLDPDLQSVLLTIGSPFFIDQSTYTLSFNNSISDCSGNSVETESITFSFFQAQAADRYDVLINEFYPDFNPSLGLPEKEFVELYNRSNKTINLEGFSIVNGTTEITLPFFLLQPDQYVTLYKTGGLGFGALGDTIALIDFIGLGNEADEFELLDPNGEVIHSVAYDKSWYQDTDKTDGGWSIELINPGSPCSFQTNWRASVSEIGGTPGQENSVLDLEADDTTLDLIRAFPESLNEVKLFFNKALEESTALNLDNYTVDGLTILEANLLAPFNIVLLRFSENLDESQVYEISLRSDITDCVGNNIGLLSTTKFAVPQNIGAGEIIINELLYDPNTGGVRFVELVNVSNKTFNLGDLNIADRDEEGEEIDSNIEIEQEQLFFPGEYLVLTPFPQNIEDNYFVENPLALIQSSLPSYDDREDAVVIFVPSILGLNIIDELKYTRDFHNPLLDDEEGVSLERINFDGTTSDRSNWQSAAETAGYATPTYLNSQYAEGVATSGNTFEIPNTTLSPDGDGFEDFLTINYITGQGGWVANIQIFDANGRLIKRLVQNQSLASNGSFKWEGDTDDGVKARIGIYIVWIEVFKSDGTVEQIKKTCVLAGQF